VPPIATRIGAFDFRGVSFASGDVGGDLIDVVEREGGWIAYVADVSGHGVGAGLLMGMVKSATRMQLKTGQSIDRLLDSLNGTLIDLSKPEMYVTFAGLLLDGPDTLRFAVAGHPPILHYHAASSTLTELTLPQIPLAMFADRSFSVSDRLAYGSGDLFVLLTDGVTDVFDRDDRDFGFDRVKALVQAHATAPLDRLQDILINGARAHGPQTDDQTLLLVRAI
jgi:serine phosphatase RsbU (regulator of sigma subunit)